MSVTGDSRGVTCRELFCDERCGCPFTVMHFGRCVMYASTP